MRRPLLQGKQSNPSSGKGTFHFHLQSIRTWNVGGNGLATMQLQISIFNAHLLGAKRSFQSFLPSFYAVLPKPRNVPDQTATDAIGPTSASRRPCLRFGAWMNCLEKKWGNSRNSSETHPTQKLWKVSGQDEPSVSRFFLFDSAVHSLVSRLYRGRSHVEAGEAKDHRQTQHVELTRHENGSHNPPSWMQNKGNGKDLGVYHHWHNKMMHKVSSEWWWHSCLAIRGTFAPL